MAHQKLYMYFVSSRPTNKARSIYTISLFLFLWFFSPSLDRQSNLSLGPSPRCWRRISLSDSDWKLSLRPNESARIIGAHKHSRRLASTQHKCFFKSLFSSVATFTLLSIGCVLEVLLKVRLLDLEAVCIEMYFSERTTVYRV